VTKRPGAAATFAGTEVTMEAPLLTAKDAIELSDGRRLSYSTTGPRDGVPLLYFHGAIGSPLQREPALERELHRSRIRYLMVDRPGFGASDPAPGRRVADFAADVEELAEALGMLRFSIVGVSAGAPYALACARALPDRVAAVAAVSTIPPGLAALPGMARRYRLPLMALSRWPWAIGWTVDRLLRAARRHPGLLAQLLALGASAGDRQVLNGRESRELAARRFLAALQRGPWPMIEDYLVCCSDWGFALEEVEVPVELWHGAADPVIPAGRVRGLADRLPACRFRIADGEGHFFFRKRIAEILRPLALAAADGGGAAATELAA
jgi:pimeloyl-ACP methyl ester carboxylesterase